ncbi:hypothetical protein [Nocardia brasiliensis]|uniref:hypothetical protein n=1 Tax=Nocardia brasiliensis TaxID=37326 RepID=UPI00366D1628
MTTSPISDEFPTLTGRQEPHYSSEFDGSDVRGNSALKLAGRVGRRSFPWQVHSLLAILRTTPEGRWTHPDVVLIVPRQNGKTLIIVLRVLYGLFVRHERIVYTAQRWKTAEDAYKRLWAIIRVRKSLLSRVARRTLSQGIGEIELSTGGRILFCTRSADAGRGLDVVDLVVYDEAYNLTEAETSALNPTQLAADDPQTIYTSSPVNKDLHPNGSVLAGLRKQGYARSIGLYFAEWLAPGDMPRDAEATWRYANPSYGVIQTAAKVLKLLRTATTAAGRKAFDVEILGRGDYPDEEADRPALLPDGTWARMGEAGVTVRGPIAIAVDMTPDLTTCAIGAATWTEADKVRVELGWHGPSTDLVARVVDLVDRWDPCAVVINSSSPAVGVIADKLRAVGIEPELTTSTQMADAVVGFVDDALAERLSHAGDSRLEEIESVQTKQLGNGGRMVLDYAAGDVTRAQVVMLARWGLLAYGVELRPAQLPTQVDEDSTDHSPVDELMVIGF